MGSMNVVSVCPLRVASLGWQTSRGVPVLTVIAKATYDLAPDTCQMAEEQEDPTEYESHWNDDPERSLHLPSDFSPFKPRPEVTLVGQAFAPRGEPVARLVARLAVGSVDKSIVVHAERSFSQDGVLRHGARFKRMPVRYERAAGGPETNNPVGVTRKPDALGVVTLPNLEPPGLNVTRPDDFIELVGFGPIAEAWPARQSRLGRYAGSWSVSALQTAALPDEIDPLYFLSAPKDQHLDELWSNERIVLENLHPDHPRLVTRLPGYEPRAFVEGPRGAVAELAMTCDTLWIDTDRAMCTLTWRGQITLDHPAMEGRVVVAMEMIGRQLAWSTVEKLAAASSGPKASPVATLAGPMRNVSTDAPSWPTWLASDEEESPTISGITGSPAKSPASAGSPAKTPAIAGSPAGALLKPEARPITRDVKLDADGTGTMEVSVPMQVIDAAMARAEAERARPPAPVVAAPSRSATASAKETPPPAWQWAPAPPPLRPEPSAWAAGASLAAGATPAPLPSNPWAPAAAAAAPIAPALRAAYTELPSSPGLSSRSRPPEPSPPARAAAAADLRQATERGAAAASDAAAAGAWEAAPPADRSAGAQPAATAREPAREHVDLLWFDPAALPRILADKVLGEGRADRPSPRWVKEPASAREPQQAKDRREILAVVTRVRPIDDLAGIGHITSAAYADDGTFTAPLILVAGELAFDFDEVETLRATLSVTAPFLGLDKKLREVAAGAGEALKVEGRLAGDIAAGLTRRVEEAFAQSQRSVAPRYLETTVERMLLEDRRYPKKTLFGEPRLRAVLNLAGGAAPIPTYLPGALATRLPLFRRFRIRAIVEVRPQEDQYETHTDALLVLALGRVLRRSG